VFLKNLCFRNLLCVCVCIIYILFIFLSNKDILLKERGREKCIFIILYHSSLQQKLYVSKFFMMQEIDYKLTIFL